MNRCVFSPAAESGTSWVGLGRPPLGFEGFEALGFVKKEKTPELLMRELN
jgi:hypothetical protein